MAGETCVTATDMIKSDKIVNSIIDNFNADSPELKNLIKHLLYTIKEPKTTLEIPIVVKRESTEGSGESAIETPTGKSSGIIGLTSESYTSQTITFGEELKKINPVLEEEDCKYPRQTLEMIAGSLHAVLLNWFPPPSSVVMLEPDKVEDPKEPSYGAPYQPYEHSEMLNTNEYVDLFKVEAGSRLDIPEEVKTMVPDIQDTNLKAISIIDSVGELAKLLFGAIDKTLTFEYPVSGKN
jgi:hypothetical protein